MHKIITLLFLSFCAASFGQVKGKITSADGQPIPFVSILIQNTYTGTSANEEGLYELGIKSPGKYTLVFQSLGFRTKTVPVNITAMPHMLNVTLEDETYQLGEVTISSADNPANAIIRNAIENRKANSARTGKFEADFYSKGIFRVKDLPKKIMGVEVGDMDGMVDSTGTGVLYLSETVSKITFEQPNNLKERIIASKISGNDNGFSYNTAMATNYNFYENYVPFGVNMVSPIANNAFNYYKFQLEGTFFDDNNNMINKIKLVPRRDKEPVFEGYIYIVEDSWAIYAVDVDIKGYRMQQPLLETLNLTQNFSYNSNNRLWAKNSQTFDFRAGAFGIKFTGKFTHVFTNYVFYDKFEKDTFGKEIVYIEKDSNKKDSLYWNTTRPVPLTDEEVTDYVKKDSLQTLRTSQTYLDSIDRKSNKFKPFDILTGYTYRNSFRKTRYSYDGLLGLSKIGFNTVQGWNFNTGLLFGKTDEDTGKSTFIRALFDYGVAEDRLRVQGRFSHRFNRQNYATLYLSGGSVAEQFNPSEPISRLVNTVSTLFFKDNYMKLYDKTFAKAQYQQEVFTGLSMYGSVEYSRRKPLFNNTDYVLIKDNDTYTSNNPLDPFNETSVPFENHHLTKAAIGGSIRFGQKYITRPDGKVNVGGGKYPVLYFQYEKAFAGSEENYEYDFLAGRITYGTTLGNKGDFDINLKGGKFFNAEGISFADYKHFNGNQTHVGDGSYLNSFHLLPYYTHSTNDAYLETHAEHNFKGYIMNKIPLLSLLQWNLVVGHHSIAIPDRKPYHEFSAGFDNVGFGKFRLFRVDYVRAYQGGFATDGIMIGMKFLGMME